MALRYQVRHLFAHDGVTLTNDHEAEIKALPREVRDHHIERGNLVEWDDRTQDDPPGDAAPLAPATTPGKKGR